MELLPTQGQTLRHYTATRPRPRRTRTQPPSSSSSSSSSSSKPQEPASETENDSNVGMGRVDEGVEEFFTKKILPDSTLKGRWEESNPARATPTESGSTPSAPSPLPSFSSDNLTESPSGTPVTSPSVPTCDSSLTHTAASANLTSALSTSVTSPISTPSFNTTTTTTTSTALPPSKNIKKKFGDFFAFKRARAGRATKAGGGEGGGGGGGEGAKVKRTSIADLIRPLREAKEREKERERGARSVDNANVSNGATITEGAAAVAELPQDGGDQKDRAALPATVSATTGPSPSSGGGPASSPTPTTGTNTPAGLLVAVEPGGEVSLPRGPTSPGLASPGSPGPTPPDATSVAKEGHSRGAPTKLGGSMVDGERRLKVTRRSLREGKSQSLILLTGLEPEDKESMHSKKHSSESTSSFEQRLQLMLHRMGVSKTPPANTKTSQNKDDELRKANSEGAILDKPQAPPVFRKPRTMSTSSDTRHPVRPTDRLPSDPLTALQPERPTGPLPPKPAIAAKPPIPPVPSVVRITVTVPVPGATLGPGHQQLAPSCPQGLPAATAPCSGVPAGGQLAGTPVHKAREEQSWAQKQGVPAFQGALQNEGTTSAPDASSREMLPTTSPRRTPGAQDRSEKAQSVTDESLPKPRQRMKPVPQRRAVSVHEDAFAMTQELKAVLQRSPTRHCSTRGALPTCAEHILAERGGRAGKMGKRVQGRRGVEEETEEGEAEGRRTGDVETAAREPPPPPGEKKIKTPFGEKKDDNKDDKQAARMSTLGDKEETLTQPITTAAAATAQPRPSSPATASSLSTTQAPAQTTERPTTPPCTAPARADPVNSTKEEGPDQTDQVLPRQTVKAQPSEQRTEAPPV